MTTGSRWTKVDAAIVRETRRRISKRMDAELVEPCPERQAEIDKLRRRHDELMVKYHRCSGRVAQ